MITRDTWMWRISAVQEGLLFHFWKPDEHGTRRNFPLKANYLCIPINVNYIAGNYRSCEVEIECLKLVFAELLCKS